MPDLENSRRQHRMLITFSGVDGGGKSSQARVLHNAFALSHIRSHILWMRIGETLTMRVLRAGRYRVEHRKAPGTKRTFDRTGWRLVLWLILASVEYAVWLQRVRWLLWRGDVVIADRYLCDFEVEVTLRLETKPRLASALLAPLRLLAPRPALAYLLRISPELSRDRKPEPDFRGLDADILQPRYDQLAQRYALRLYDGSQSFDELSREIVRDAMGMYMAYPSSHFRQPANRGYIPVLSDEDDREASCQ